MKEYIEREAVEKMLEDAQLISDGEYCGYCTEDINLSSIPAADVDPVRHGKWLKNSHDDPYCSVCGATERDTYDAVTEECKYCYSCGAQMNEKVNNI